MLQDIKNTSELRRAQRSKQKPAKKKQNKPRTKKKSDLSNNASDLNWGNIIWGNTTSNAGLSQQQAEKKARTPLFARRRLEKIDEEEIEPEDVLDSPRKHNKKKKKRSKSKKRRKKHKEEAELSDKDELILENATEDVDKSVLKDLPKLEDPPKRKFLSIWHRRKKKQPEPALNLSILPQLSDHEEDSATPKRGTKKLVQKPEKNEEKVSANEKKLEEENEKTRLIRKYHKPSPLKKPALRRRAALSKYIDKEAKRASERRRRQSTHSAIGLVGEAMGSIGEAVLSEEPVLSGRHRQSRSKSHSTLEENGVLLQDLLVDSCYPELREIGYQDSFWRTSREAKLDATASARWTNSIFVPNDLPEQIAFDLATYFILYTYIGILDHLLGAVSLFLMTSPVFEALGIAEKLPPAILPAAAVFLSQLIHQISYRLARRTATSMDSNGRLKLRLVGRIAPKVDEMLALGTVLICVSSLILLLPAVVFQVLVITLPPEKAPPLDSQVLTEAKKEFANKAIILPTTLVAILICFLLSTAISIAGYRCFQWVHEERVKPELSFFSNRENVALHERKLNQIIEVSSIFFGLLALIAVGYAGKPAALGLFCTFFGMYCLFAYQTQKKLILHVLDSTMTRTLLGMFIDAEDDSLCSERRRPKNKLFSKVASILRLRNKPENEDDCEEVEDQRVGGRAGLSLHPSVVYRECAKSQVGTLMVNYPITLGAPLTELILKSPKPTDTAEGASQRHRISEKIWEKLVGAHTGRRFLVAYKDEQVLVALHEEATDLDVLQALFEANQFRYRLVKREIRKRINGEENPKPSANFLLPSKSTSSIRWEDWVHFVRLLHEGSCWAIDRDGLGDTYVRNSWEIKDPDQFR